jgi:hypothetical protein
MQALRASMRSGSGFTNFRQSFAQCSRPRMLHDP